MEEASSRVRSTMTTRSLRLGLHDSGAATVLAWENIFIAALSLLCCSVLGHWPIISAKWDAAGSNGSAGKALARMDGTVQKRLSVLRGFQGPQFDTLPPTTTTTTCTFTLTYTPVMKE